MSEGLENVKHKAKGISKLESVVKTMKILSAANMAQYEQAISALATYAQVIELGLSVCFKDMAQNETADNEPQKDSKTTYLIVFGSDQGLVGQFNEVVNSFTNDFLSSLQGDVQLWVVGERIYTRLEESGAPLVKKYDVPTHTEIITQLVGQLLIDCQSYRPQETMSRLFVIHNQLKGAMNYEPVVTQILPLDREWQRSIASDKWPTKKLPEIMGLKDHTLGSLIKEFIFISLYKSCAHSLASENASRLASMQRAEKNIEELVDQMDHSVQQLRQKNIDEEIFDVISGSEDLLTNGQT